MTYAAAAQLRGAVTLARVHLISSVVWMHGVAGVGTTSRLTACIQMHPGTSQ